MPVSHPRLMPAINPLGYPDLSIDPNIRKAIEALQLAINDIYRRLPDPPTSVDQPDDHLPQSIEIVSRLAGPLNGSSLLVMAQRCVFQEGRPISISPEYLISTINLPTQSQGAMSQSGGNGTGNGITLIAIYAGIYGVGGG